MCLHLFLIRGEESENHSGQAKGASDNYTLIFTPTFKVSSGGTVDSLFSYNLPGQII